MSDTIELNAQAQVRRREANERVADVYYKFAARGALDMSIELIDLSCECGRETPCGEHVKVSAAMYEHVRDDANVFILYPGHEASAVEYTIGRGQGFVIARNIGRAAEIARAADPRRSVERQPTRKPVRLVF